MTNTVFLVWQDNITRLWHPVGKLAFQNGVYRFNYTKGASHPRFKPFLLMENIEKVYESDELFPFFANRIMAKERPEFTWLSSWSGLGGVENTDFNPLEFLSRTGGRRGTDNYRVIPCPEKDGDSFTIRFFANGIRYLSDKERSLLAQLRKGEKLQLIKDDENTHDPSALKLVFNNNKVGFCPRYLSPDFRKIIENENIIDYSVSVIKFNPDAPATYQLMCEFTSKWPDNFEPFINDEYLAVK